MPEPLPSDVANLSSKARNDMDTLCSSSSLCVNLSHPLKMIANKMNKCNTHKVEGATSGWKCLVRHLARPVSCRDAQCRQSRNVVRALDRTLVASAATASKEITQDAPRIVVRHLLDSKAE